MHNTEERETTTLELKTHGRREPEFGASAAAEYSMVQNGFSLYTQARTGNLGETKIHQ
jgi:hypothetical protein